MLRVVHTNTLIPHLPSSLQELTLSVGDDQEIELLPHENTNLKKLTISGNLLHPLAALIVNIHFTTYPLTL